MRITTASESVLVGVVACILILVFVVMVRNWFIQEACDYQCAQRGTVSDPYYCTKNTAVCKPIPKEGFLLIKE